MKSVLIAFAAAALAGCVSVPSDKAVLVEEVEIGAVKGCEDLGQVKGHSGWGGSAGESTGQNNSHVSAKEKAAALGATHMVWVAEGNGMMSTAVARAYRCAG